jgi:hypothetical protein
MLIKLFNNYAFIAQTQLAINSTIGQQENIVRMEIGLSEFRQIGIAFAQLFQGPQCQVSGFSVTSENEKL